MKKIRLDTDYIYDFELMGLVSSAKGHKLAWEINLKLDMKLIRKPDLLIQFNDQTTNNYTHFSSDYHLNTIRLLKNQPSRYGKKNAKKYLIPEYFYVDYIFMYQGENRHDQNWFEKYLSYLTPVEMLVFIPLDMIKSKELFLF